MSASAANRRPSHFWRADRRLRCDTDFGCLHELVALHAKSVAYATFAPTSTSANGTRHRGHGPIRSLPTATQATCFGAVTRRAPTIIAMRAIHVGELQATCSTR